MKTKAPPTKRNDRHPGTSSEKGRPPHHISCRWVLGASHRRMVGAGGLCLRARLEAYLLTQSLQVGGQKY